MPVVKWWSKIKPKEGQTANSFHRVGGEWEVLSRRSGANGTAQAALTKIERALGFTLGLKLHSPRTFFATCAGLLRFPREEREKLGRWAAASVMPDRYGRAVCVTELLLRGDILRRISEQ